jgi:hypothetical protein
VTLSLFLDVIVAVLLVATIVYAAMLNRRLAGLRSNKAELEALIHSFGEACARAEAGVKTLRTATDEATRLQQYLDRSQALRDDLSFLLDRGSNLADRLEGGVRSARSEVQARPAPIPTADAEPTSVGRFGRPQRGGAEPRGMDAPASMADAEPRVRPLRDRMAPEPAAARAPLAAERPIAAAADHGHLEDAAERAAERLAQRVNLGERPAGGERPVRPGRPERAGRSALRAALGQAAAPGIGMSPADGAGDGAPRSKAERELLQALRTRR